MPDPSGPDPSSEVRRRVARSLLRPGRGQLIAALLLFVVGLASAAQIRTTSDDEAYSGARREDLIGLLDGLSAQSRRLESEIVELERTRLELESGANSQRVARQEAQQRLEVLSILAGSAPARGPGIRIRITDPAGKVGPELMLDLVSEMRDAGAEAIEINDSLRIVGSSWFGLDSRGLVVDGKPVTKPLTVDVIGDPHSLEEAVRFRGGVESEITNPRIGGAVSVSQNDQILVTSLHSLRRAQYAQPASPPPTRR